MTNGIPRARLLDDSRAALVLLTPATLADER